jgi:hypothetical protein
MTVTLIHSNALTLPLADQSVHLVVTSPPYFSLRSYRDGDEHYAGQLGSEATPHHFLAALWAVLDECWRVLRDDGSAWINLGDKFAGSGGHNNSNLSGAAIDRGPKECQDCGNRTDRKRCHRCGGVMRWPKKERQATTRRQAPDRYNQSTGGLRPKSRMLLPHLFAAGCQYPWLRQAVETQAGLEPTADPPQWICRMDVVWSKPSHLPESVKDRVVIGHEYLFHLTKSERYYATVDMVRKPADDAERRLGSVWTIATEPLILPDHLPDHFAAFPSALPSRIVRGWSPSNVCRTCGFLLGSSYDYGMLGVRKPDHRCSPQGWAQRFAEPCGQEQSLLLEEVLDPAHRTKSCEHEVPASDDPRLRRGVEAEPSDGPEERLHDGAPARDGGAPGANAGEIGGCPPRQRGQDGQPDRELGAAERDGSQPAAQGGPQTVPVPALRRARSDVRELVACPHCGGRDFAPSVTVDPFGGTGTTAIVASALGRHGISVDLSADYHRIARWRDADGGLRAKALGVARPEKQVEGQLSLLEGGTQ